MLPRIEILPAKKFIGKKMIMSLAANRTTALWQSFMVKRNEVQNRIGTDFYSMQMYDPNYFENFNAENEFAKWALVEVSDFHNIPDEMETITIPGGLYAVFIHIGGAKTGPATFQHIFQNWLPGSGYRLDNRPHFEILGSKYKNEDPASEEEIWIPIKPQIENNF